MVSHKLSPISLLMQHTYYSTRTLLILVFAQSVTVMNVNDQRSKLGDRSKMQHSILRQSSS